MASPRRPRDPPDQRARRRLLPRADERELRALREPLERARDERSPPCLRRRPPTFPISSGRTSSWRCASRRVSDDGAHRLEPRARHRRRTSTRTTSSRSRCRTRTRCTRASSAAARTSCGPLARFKLNFDRAGAARAGSGREARARPPPSATRSRASSSAASRSLGVRRGAADDRRVRGARRPAVRRGASRRRGHGCTEAPRGMLYHRYELDADGTILRAKIVPPTSQNQARIEGDLRGSSTGSLELADEATWPALRADDPQLRSVHLVRDALPEAGRHANVKVIGVGNRWRSDDGIGLVVASARARPRTRRRRGRRAGGRAHRAPERVRGRPGRGRRRRGLIGSAAGHAAPARRRVCTAGRTSSSSLDPSPRLPEAVGLARALGRLPAQLYVVGVEGSNWEAGDRLSAPVAAAVENAVAAVLAEVERCSSPRAD